MYLAPKQPCLFVVFQDETRLYLAPGQLCLFVSCFTRRDKIVSCSRTTLFVCLFVSCFPRRDKIVSCSRTTLFVCLFDSYFVSQFSFGETLISEQIYAMEIEEFL